MSEADEWKKWDGWVPGDPVPGDVPGTGPRRTAPRGSVGKSLLVIGGFVLGLLIFVVPALLVIGLVRFTSDVDRPASPPATIADGEWPAPDQLVVDLSTAAGRPVTHVVSLHVEASEVVSADVVWPERSDEVERWTLSPSGPRGPFDAPPLDGRPVVALADLGATPFAAMVDRAIGTLAAGGGVERIVVRASPDGSPRVTVHVGHSAGSAGHVVFDASGDVLSIDAL